MTDPTADARARRPEPEAGDGMNTPDAPLTAERLAQSFHESYERLAPVHGYETREASAKPWADVPANNRALMTAVCAEVMSPLTAELDALRAPVDLGYDGEAVDEAADLLRECQQPAAADMLTTLADLVATAAHTIHARDVELAAARVEAERRGRVIGAMASTLEATAGKLADADAEVLKRGKVNAAAIALNTTLTRELEAARQQLDKANHFVGDRALRDLLDAPALSPTVQAEPADQLCSDKSGFHDGHDWRPDQDDLVWCPGYPVPKPAAAPVVAEATQAEPWALSVSCPGCGAPERIWCFEAHLGGHSIGHVHPERRQRAADAVPAAAADGDGA